MKCYHSNYHSSYLASVIIVLVTRIGEYEADILCMISWQEALTKQDRKTRKGIDSHSSKYYLLLHSNHIQQLTFLVNEANSWLTLTVTTGYFGNFSVYSVKSECILAYGMSYWVRTRCNLIRLVKTLIYWIYDCMFWADVHL